MDDEDIPENPGTFWVFDGEDGWPKQLTQEEGEVALYVHIYMNFSNLILHFHNLTGVYWQLSKKATTIL